MTVTDVSVLCSCCGIESRQLGDPFAFDVCDGCEWHLREQYRRPGHTARLRAQFCPWERARALERYDAPPAPEHTRFWLGWWSNKKIKGAPHFLYWESGWRARPRAWSFVGLIDATSDEAAWQDIERWFGKGLERRFCEVSPDMTRATLRAGGRFT